MKPKKRARKPTDLVTDCVIAKLNHDGRDFVVWVETLWPGLRARDCKRLSAWLLKAARYLESKNGS